MKNSGKKRLEVVGDEIITGKEHRAEGEGGKGSAIGQRVPAFHAHLILYAMPHSWNIRTQDRNHISEDNFLIILGRLCNAEYRISNFLDFFFKKGPFLDTTKLRPYGS